MMAGDGTPQASIPERPARHDPGSHGQSQKHFTKIVIEEKGREEEKSRPQRTVADTSAQRLAAVMSSD